MSDTIKNQMLREFYQGHCKPAKTPGIAVLLSSMLPLDQHKELIDEKHLRGVSTRIPLTPGIPGFGYSVSFTSKVRQGNTKVHWLVLVFLRSAPSFPSRIGQCFTILF